MALARKRSLRAAGALGAALLAVHAPEARAQARPAIVINDTRVFPESLTSAADGSVFFGSIEKGVVYRAAPGTARAEVWIPAPGANAPAVLGVLADDRAGLLWVCSSPMAGPAGAPAPAGEVALKAYDLKTAAPKGSYAFPGGGLCNDIAVAADGTAYATDTPGGRILRLKPGARTLDVWATDPLLTSIDGIALLADGAVYANGVRTGVLARVPVQADGSAGAVVKIETSRPIARPDGMRAVGAMTLLLVEGEGRLDEVTVTGARADVRVIKEGVGSTPTAVTLVGNTAFVLDSKFTYRNDPALKGQDPGVFQAAAVAYAPAK